MAVGTTEFIDNTNAAVFLPVIYSLQAVVARDKNTLMSGLVNKTFEKDLSVGKDVKIPNISHLTTARTKSANTAITYEAITETNQTLTVNTHNYQAIAIESITELQTDRDLKMKYSAQMGYSLALAFDDSLTAYFDDFTKIFGTDNVAITADNILAAIAYLNSKDVPKTDRWFVVSNEQAVAFLSTTSDYNKPFVNNDYSKLQGKFAQHPAMGESYVTSWVGLPIYETSNTPAGTAGHKMCIAHREAIAAVMQMSPKTWTFDDIDYFAHKMAIEQVYGSKVIRSDHAVYIKGT